MQSYIINIITQWHLLAQWHPYFCDKTNQSDHLRKLKTVFLLFAKHSQQMKEGLMFGPMYKEQQN